MAIELSSKVFGPKAPVLKMRLTGARERRPALWPTASIVILLSVQVIFAPLVLTILNSMLVLLAVAIVLLAQHRIDPRLFFIIGAYLVMGFLGLATGLGTDQYEYFKDAWYVMNPALIMLTGYVLYMAKPDLSRGLRAFVIGGVIVGIWQVRGYFFFPEIIMMPAVTIRKVIGTGFYAPVLAVVVLLATFPMWRERLKLHPVVGWVLLTIASLAVIGVFSRTAVMVIGLGLLAAWGAFAAREWLRLLFPVVGLVLVTSVMQVVIDVDSNRSLETFAGKFALSLRELAVAHYSDVRDINLNFRGYETKRALLQFGEGSAAQMLFGQGFGATVDLGISMPLEVTSSGTVRLMRHVGLLHNGYMFLLIKVGIIGLACYIAVLLYLYRVGRRYAALPKEHEQRLPGRLLQASVVTLAATTYIVGGVFNKMDMFAFTLFTGYLLAHLREKPVTAVKPQETISAKFSA